MRVAKVGLTQGNNSAYIGGDKKYGINLANLDVKTTDPDIIKLCFTVYPDQDHFEKALLKRENIWVIYKFDPQVYGRINQKEYESFVCGFLQYYDREVRNGMIDHTIYFHWGGWGTDQDCVVIFIDKPPARYPNTDSLSDSIVRNYPADYYNKTSEVPPPISQSKVTDPPKPPGPPPPY